MLAKHPTFLKLNMRQKYGLLNPIGAVILHNRHKFILIRSWVSPFGCSTPSMKEHC